MSKVALKRVVEPLIEPVSIVDVKNYTRVTKNTEDGLINTWIRSARINAENYQRHSYITQRWQLTLNRFPGDTETLWLPRGPLQNLASISMTDSLGAITSFDITKFIVDTDTSTIKLIEDEEWNEFDITLNNIKIIYSTGYGSSTSDVPAYVADAIYVYVAYRYENRLGETNMIPNVFYQILDEERSFRGLL
jgi:uncharacterized phiE125 gp8 family phage protein